MVGRRADHTLAAPPTRACPHTRTSVGVLRADASVRRDDARLPRALKTRRNCCYSRNTKWHVGCIYPLRAQRAGEARRGAGKRGKINYGEG
jgi:hypothetical protein